jgi:UPF0716 protein FxsA
LLPFMEIDVFVAVVVKLGFLAAVALTILTSLAGMSVIRQAGQTEVARVRSAFGERTITRKSLDGRGFLTVLGGFLLLLPGFLTDLLGLLLLLPLTQQSIVAALRRALARAERASSRPDVVDLPPGEWRRLPEERLTQKPSPGTD